MLDYGKVTDTIYKRSVRKVIERNVTGAEDDRIGGRDILYFAADSDKAMLTAFATLTGNQLAAAGIDRFEAYVKSVYEEDPNAVNFYD